MRETTLTAAEVSTTVLAPVSNFYGVPYVRHDGERFVIGLEGQDGGQEVPISREFYAAWVREFGTVEQVDTHVRR